MYKYNTYIRVKDQYVKFIGRSGEYKFVNNKIDATAFPDASSAAKACRKSDIKAYKFVSTNASRRM